MSGFNANDLAKERCFLASRRYEQMYIHVIVSDQICFNDQLQLSTLISLQIHVPGFNIRLCSKLFWLPLINVFACFCHLVLRLQPGGK